MPKVWLDVETARKAHADLWEQQARQTIADAWEAHARLGLPDLLAEAHSKIASVVHPDMAAGAAPASPPLPAPAPGVSTSPPPAASPPADTFGQPAMYEVGAGVAGQPAQTPDYQAYARQAAERAGTDPERFVRQIAAESNFNPTAVSPAGARGIAQIVPQYHPGVNPDDPYASLDYAANLVASHERTYGSPELALVAYNGGQGAVDAWQAGRPYGESSAYVNRIMGGQQAAAGNPSAGQPATRTSQFGMGLSDADAYAFCGPAAAIAFAQTYGRNPTVDEARQLAKQYGWTPEAGMAGILSEQKLLSEGLGIPTKLEQQVDWSHVARDASTGNPVIISTPGHYFYVSGFNPEDGTYQIGTSGTDLRGGSAWMTPDQMQQSMGQVQGALYADNPHSPLDSIAKGVGDFFSGVGSAVHDSQFMRNVTGTNPNQAEMEARWANSGVTIPHNPLELLGGAGLGAPTSGEQLTQERNQAIAESNPLREVPVVGGATTFGAQVALDPTNLLLAGPTAGKAALKGAEAIPRRLPAEINPELASGGLTKLIPEGTPPTPPPPVEPHGLTINLPKYTPPEVRDIIQQAYDSNPQIMDAARRGVVPDDIVKELATQVGVNAGRIANLWKPGQAKNAETILALRQALADQSQRVVTAQQAVLANPTSLDAQQQLVQALYRHAAVQETVTGVTAEAGRALRQFRQPIEGAQASLDALQKLAKQWKVAPEELAGHLAKVDLSDPAAVAGLARNLVQHSPADYLSSLWYFNLLSSPLSHVRNVVSNSVTAVVAPLEVLPSATMDVARSAITGGPRQRFYGELGARFVGLGAGMREGVTNALQIFAHGFTDEQAAGKLAGLAAREPFRGPVGAVINAPGRALGAEDAFFRAINKTAELYAQAYRIASQEELKGQPLIDRVTDLRRAPTLDMLAAAEKEGAYRVFQQDGQFVRWATQMPGPMRFFVPFVRTPYNIAKYTAAYSPLGAIKPTVQALRGTASAGEIQDQLARAAIGSAIMGGLYLWARDGNLTGAAPLGEAERDAFLREHPQYSMKIGDHWFSYQALQPFSSLFAVAAAVNDAQQRGLKLEPAAAFTLGAFGVAKSLLDMPWTQGLADTLQTTTDPQRMAPTYAKHISRSLAFPTALWGWINRATDNMLRDPQDAGQAFVGQFPGLTGVQPPRQDAFGRDVPRPPEQMGLGSLNPFNPAPVKNDPVDKALADLQLHGFAVEPGFVGDKASVPKIPTQVTLTNDEQRQIQRVSGQLAYATLLPMVTSASWQNASPELRAKVVDSVISKTRDYARAQLIPQLAPRAIEVLKQELSTGVRKPAPKPAGAP